MTENEAIEQLKQEIGARTWYKILSSEKIAKIQAGDFHEFVEACKLSISALKEIQEYRATGLSPSMIEDLKKSEKQAHKDAMENALKLEEYEALGTKRELREAMEKQRAKKPYVEKQKSPGLRGDYDCYECPNCDSFLAVKSDADSDENYRTNYCPYCGQEIDWSVEND